MRAQEFVTEKWSAKYKRSINCANPKGFSQRAHCQGRKKNEDLNEFAPGGGSSSSYYAVTSNFVNEFSQQKQEELQDLIDAGWTKQDLAQAGTIQGQAADIAHFEQVRNGFLKGLKPGFDAYLQGDTQMKDQLGAYWIENDLPLNQDWEKIYGEPWGDDGLDEQQLDELMFKGSQCTKDCSGHRAGYEWSARKGNRTANSWSQSFNNGAAIRNAGR
jgi:hypothetical protein